MKLLVTLSIFAVVAFAQDDFAAFQGDEDDIVASPSASVDDSYDDMVVEVVEEEAVDEDFSGRVELGDQIMDRTEDEFDPEEFENIPPEEKKSEGLNIIEPSEVPKDVRPTKAIYTIEYGLSAILILYIVNYIYGRVQNGTIATDWFGAAQPFLESQFALVGDSLEKEPVSSLTMNRDADHVFSIWCSGRISTNGMLATLRLNKRQDALNSIYFSYIQPTADKMILKFTMERMEPMCFVIGRSTSVKEILENYPDVTNFCNDKIRSAEKIGLSSMSYVTESTDALAVFDKKMIGSLLGAGSDALVSLHVSDSFVGPRVPDGEETDPLTKSCIFVFEMKDVQKCATQYLKMAVYFVDQLAKFNLNKDAYEKHKKRRAKQAEVADRQRHQDRQEELAKKKEDNRREEYKKMFDEQDPDKQKKLEYDLNKRDLKRQQRKQKPKMSFRT